MKKNIFIPFILIMSTCHSQMDKDSFTTIDLINESLPALFDCSHYCIVGIDFRIKFDIKGGIVPFQTLIIRHNTADLIALSARETSEMPWLEYRNIFAAMIKKLGDSLLQSLTGVSVFEVGGGQTEYADYGAHQTLNFKDADVMGNPLAYVVEKLDGHVSDGGNSRKNRTNDGENDTENSDIDPNSETGQLAIAQLLQAYIGNGDFFLSHLAFMMMGGPFYKEIVMNHPTTYIYDLSVRTLVNEFAAAGGMDVDFYACDTMTQPYKPYYISNLDGYFWRDGFPITDPHMIVDMINPLSKHMIKPTIDVLSVGGVDLNIMTEWGALYPRSGFLNHGEDHKHGAVTAARALSIATDPLPTRIHQFAGGSYDEVLWQPLHPIVETACYQNIANSITDKDRNLKQNYAWNAWRRYECSLSKKGFSVQKIYFGNDFFCMGNGPKDKP